MKVIETIDVQRKKSLILVMCALILVICLFAFIIWAGIIAEKVVTKHYELEQKKLELARYQFEVQSEQINNSIRLQEANETMRLLEMLMNSRLMETAANDLLGAPKEVGNAAKDLAVELIRTLKINVDCTPRWLCDNKDLKSAKIPVNSSATECQPQNTPAKSLWAGNNNRENICFECRYMNLDTWQIPDSYSNPRGTS